MDIRTIIVIGVMVILTIHQWKLKKRGWATMMFASLIFVCIVTAQSLNILPK